MNYVRVFSLCTIFAVSQFTQVELNFAPAPNHLKFLDYKQIVDTEFVPLSPLYFHGGLKEKWLVNQTGQSVEVLVDQPFTVGSVTGGVLYGDKYKFHKFRYYWHDNITTNGHHALSTVNGQNGAHLEVVVYFYNEKYGSFDNSLNYRDGLVAVSSRVNVGWVSNPVYVPFQEIFKKKIKRPGDSVPILSSFTYLWYSTYPFNTIYYSYPGGYTDERTGKVYHCTTQIVLELVPYNFISYEQFKDTFGSLEDCSRQQLINASPQYPRGSLPMKKSHGFILKNVIA